jgi:hypothetical protein
LVARAPFKDILALGHAGKLAKLAERAWDTHSARSGSAVPVVARLGETVLGRELPASPTVEGLFQSLSCEEARRLADALAAQVQEQIAAFLRGAAEGARVAGCGCSAGFQPAVSPTSSRQGTVGSARPEMARTACGLEARDTADWKSALHSAPYAAVVLVNMRGEWLGSYGDLSSWQRRE